MLYEANGKVYVYANNKYYEIEYKGNSLVPTKNYVLKLDNAVEITSDKAKQKLSAKSIKNDIEEVENPIKLPRRFKER